MCQKVITQVHRAGPVEMFPAHGAQAILVVHIQTQRFNIIIEYIATSWNAVTERAIEIKVDGFNAIR